MIVESRGEWAFDEGCLSVPGLYWEIVRPNEIHVTGFDLDGNEVSPRARRATPARVFQHELDHLDGVLLVEHLADEQRQEARKAIRELRMRGLGPLPEPEVGAVGACVSPERVRARTRRRAALAPAPLAVAPTRPIASPSSARPTWPCRRCGRCTPPASRSRSWSSRPDKRRGRGSGADAQPGQGGGASSSACPSPTTSTPCSAPAPTSAWWWPTAASSRAGCSRPCRW